MIRTINSYFFIYKTTCLVNGKIYVGQHQTKNLNDGYIGNGVYKQINAKSNVLFDRAVRKYGYNNFKREILEFCNDKPELNSREIYWIKKLNAHYSLGGYNMTWGGDGGDILTGHPNYVQICEKMRQAQIGNKQSAVQIRKKVENNLKLHLRGEANHNYRIPRLSISKLKQKISLSKRPVKICIYCGFKSNIDSLMKRLHFENCKCNPNYKSVSYTCPYCGKIGRSKNNMYQWHFENCKQNPNFIFKQKQIKTCPYCGFQGTGPAMKQWHFENCKFNELKRNTLMRQVV